MSYILDGTGSSTDNLVSNELIQVNTVGKVDPQLIFLDNILFYSKNFVAVYTDLVGGVRTLVYGTDYLFDFKITGVVDDNPIYAALRIENQTLNGTISLSYQALGGNWSLSLLAVREFLNSVSFNDRVSYVSLTPATPILSSDGKTPIVLNSLGALEYAQAQMSVVALKPTVMELPEKNKVLADNDGVAFDGDAERLATSVDTTGSGTGGSGGNVDVSSLAKETGGNLAIIATKANQTALVAGAVSDSAYGGSGATTIIGALKGVYNALVTSVNIRFLNSGTDSVKVEGGNTAPVLTSPSGTQAVSASELPLPTGAAKEAGGNLEAIATAQGTPSDATYASGNGSMISLLKAIFERLGNLPSGGGGSSRYLESSTDSVTAVIPTNTVVKTDGSATTQPVSVTALPLPTGAAQESGNLSTIATAAGAQADSAYAGTGSTSFIGGLKGLYERLTSLRFDVGDPAGAAWSGTGSGSLGAVLKAIYARLGGTLTTTTTVTSLPSLPAGSNAIGTVQVTNFPSTQPVSAVALPLPSGAATETGNLATVATQTTTTATATGAQTDAAYSGIGSGSVISLLKGLFSNTGTTNTNVGAQADAAWSGTGNGSLIAVLKAVYNRLSGTVAVSATSLPLPSGAATETGNLAAIATSSATTATKTTSIDTNISSVKTYTQNTATSVASLDTKTGTTADTAYNGSNGVSLVSLLKGIYTSLVGTLNTRVLDFSTDSVTIHPSGTQTVTTAQLPSSAGQHAKADSLSVVLATDQSDVKVTSTGGSLALDTSVQSVATAVAATPSYTTTLWVDKTANPFVYYVRTETKPQSGNSTISWKLVDGTAASPTVANLTAVGSMSEVRSYTSDAAATSGGIGYSSGDKLANFVGINTNVTPQTVAYSFWFNVSTGAVLTAAPTNGTYTLGPANSVYVSSSALPSNAAQETGGNLAAVATATGTQADAAWTGTGSGSVISVLKAVYGKLTSGVAVTGTFWQATQPVSAASLPLPTGAATESGNLSTIASVTGAQADAAYNGTGNSSVVAALKGIYSKLASTLSVNVSTLPSLPAGANAIGSVAVSNLPSTQAVSAVSLPLPTGAAKETGGNLSAIATATGSQADASWGGSGSGSVIAILKSLNAKLSSALSVTISGTPSVQVTSTALATNAAQETGGNLAAIVSSNSALLISSGVVSDAAWSGVGNGNSISVLKAIYGKLASALTVSQGTAGTIANAWNIKLTDGVNAADVKNYTNAKALAVALVDAAGNQITSMTGETSADRQMPMDSLAKKFSRTVVGSETYTTQNVSSLFEVQVSNASFYEQSKLTSVRGYQGGVDLSIDAAASMAGFKLTGLQIYREIIGSPSTTSFDLMLDDSFKSTDAADLLNNPAVFEFGRYDESNGYFVRANLNGISLVIVSNGVEKSIASTAWNSPYTPPFAPTAAKWEFRVSAGAKNIIKLYLNSTLKHTFTWDNGVSAVNAGPTNLDLPIWYRHYLNYTDSAGLSIHTGQGMVTLFGHTVSYDDMPMLTTKQLSGEEPALPVAISPATPIVVDPTAPVTIAGLDPTNARRPLLIGRDGGVLPSDAILVMDVTATKNADLGAFDTTGYSNIIVTVDGSINTSIQIYGSTNRKNWTTMIGVSQSGVGIVGTMTVVGSYIFPVTTKYGKLITASFVSGPAHIQVYLTNKSVMSASTNITGIQGTSPGAYGSSATSTTYGLPIQYRDPGATARAPLTDQSGNTSIGGSLKPGYKYNWNNFDFTSYGTAAYTQLRSFNQGNPVLIGGLDPTGTTKFALTDPDGHLRVRPAPGDSNEWGMAESLQEMMVLMRTALFYLYHLNASSDPNFTVNDEPATLISEYRNVLGRCAPGGDVEW